MRIVNTTRFTLNFVKGIEEPYSLNEKPTDVISVDPTVQVNATRTEAGFVVPEEEYQKLLDLVEQYKDDSEPTIIYVALPVAQEFSKREGTYKKGNVYVGLPVTATKREIKPPISIYGAVSIVEQDSPVQTEQVDVAGEIVNLTAHPLSFVVGDTILPPIPVFHTLNVEQKWVWKREGGVVVYKMATALSEEAKELLDEIIQKAEAERKKVVIYVSFMTLKTLAEAAYPTEGKYHIIVSPITEKRGEQIVALWGKGQRIVPKPAVRVEGNEIYVIMSDATTTDEIRELLLQTGKDIFRNKVVVLPAISLTEAVVYLIQELKAYTQRIEVR